MITHTVQKPAVFKQAQSQSLTIQMPETWLRRITGSRMPVFTFTYVHHAPRRANKCMHNYVCLTVCVCVCVGGWVTEKEGEKEKREREVSCICMWASVCVWVCVCTGM